MAVLLKGRGPRWSVAPIAVAMWLGACAPQTPRPPLTSHRGDLPTEVPYPPPTPRVEELGERPSATAVWVDGQWHWDGAGYAWRRGAWVEPRPGWRYAPPSVVRLRDGELLYYEGVWKQVGDDADDGDEEG